MASLADHSGRPNRGSYVQHPELGGDVRVSSPGMQPADGAHGTSGSFSIGHGTVDVHSGLAWVRADRVLEPVGDMITRPAYATAGIVTDAPGFVAAREQTGPEFVRSVVSTGDRGRPRRPVSEPVIIGKRFPAKDVRRYAERPGRSTVDSIGAGTPAGSDEVAELGHQVHPVVVD